MITEERRRQTRSLVLLSSISSRSPKSFTNGRESIKYFEKLGIETWIDGIVLSLA